MAEMSIVTPAEQVVMRTSKLIHSVTLEHVLDTMVLYIIILTVFCNLHK